MRSHNVAASLVGLYLAAVVLVLELVAWWRDSSAIIDPATLPAPLLKRLLHVRGVDYTAVVDKNELARLALQVGPVTMGEIEVLRDTLPEALAEFSGAPHMIEQVEDTKDSAWLLQVQVGSRLLLDDRTWQLVRRELAPLAIRTAVFSCDLDRRYCAAKGWTKPMLRLALPRGSRPKDAVFTTTSKHTRLQDIMGWVRQKLFSRVERVTPEKQSEWFEYTNSSTLLPVRVLLFTHLMSPPLFFAALTVKFSGRISFGMVTVGNGKEHSIERCNGSVPCYFVITPEETAVYGRRHGQHFNFHSMQAFLKPLQPEANDIFLATLAIVNIFAIILSFQVGKDCGLVGTLAVGVVAVSACNLALFVGWQVAHWAWQWFPNFAPLLRRLALSTLGAATLTNLPSLADSPVISLTSLLIYSYIARKIFGNRTMRGEQPLGSGLVELLREGPRTIELVSPSPHLFLSVGQPEHPDGYIYSLLTCGLHDVPATAKLDEECSICYYRYQEDSILTGLPCKHWFHEKCINKWLDLNPICPMCRCKAYLPAPGDM